MIDDNWELINGDDAHEIEVLNFSNQVNVIEALVRLLIYRNGVDENGCKGCPNSNVLREFHRTATLFLLTRPGSYREEAVVVKKGDGTIVHTPPAHAEVDSLTEKFFEQVTARWSSYGAVEMAAYTLWFVNWVHPFKNGNGRTARAFSYACLSLKFGFVLPGTPTVIDLIMQNRDGYQDALKVADIGYEANQEPDLSAMLPFVEGLLIQQLESITPPAANTPPTDETA